MNLQVPFLEVSLPLGVTEIGQSFILWFTTSWICEHALSRHETPRSAAMLFQQLHIGDGHAPIHGFAHVVNGEQDHWGSPTNQQLKAH